MSTVATEVERLAAALETMSETDAGVEDLAGLSEADKSAIAEAMEQLHDLDGNAEGATVKAPSIFKMTFWL